MNQNYTHILMPCINAKKYAILPTSYLTSECLFWDGDRMLWNGDRIAVPVPDFCTE